MQQPVEIQTAVDEIKQVITSSKEFNRTITELVMYNIACKAVEKKIKNPGAIGLVIRQSTALDLLLWDQAFYLIFHFTITVMIKMSFTAWYSQQAASRW